MVRVKWYILYLIIYEPHLSWLFHFILFPNAETVISPLMQLFWSRSFQISPLKSLQEEAERIKWYILDCRDRKHFIQILESKNQGSEMAEQNTGWMQQLYEIGCQQYINLSTLWVNYCLVLPYWLSSDQ